MKPLRLLLVEDLETDAELLLRQLKRSGYSVSYQRVYAAGSLTAALDGQTWDVVVSDYVMPGFSGLDALRIVQEKQPDLPCIITSGRVGEDTAVAAMRAGACDYIMKDNLRRLGPAIDRELQEAAGRRERRRAVEALRKSQEELEIVKKMDQLKDEFLGLVSHEMRNPLTVVIGGLGTVLEDEERLTREERRSLLEDAYAEAQSLSEILENLLELARLQAKRFVLAPRKVDVLAMLDGAIKKAARDTTVHRFRADVAEGLPPVTADPVRVGRVLANLLSNAVKYSPNGGEIVASARRVGDDVQLSVADPGIGISPQDRAGLFRPFQRLETTSHTTKGTGLGLVVCARLVEAHGGRIWLDSAPGKGSTFHFTLPLNKPA